MIETFLCTSLYDEDKVIDTKKITIIKLYIVSIFCRMERQ